MSALSATPGQRSYIRNLLRKLDWDQRTVTLQHRLVIIGAGLAFQEGQSVDSLLDELDKGHASALIRALEERA